MPSARTFEPASVIMDYIREERERCAALVGLAWANPQFLTYCINTPVWPDEIELHRERFYATSEKPDDFEDLM